MIEIGGGVGICALCVERSLNWMVDFSCEHTVCALSDAECVS